ncbi:lipocalin family protein [Luteimonas pelagia]
MPPSLLLVLAMAAAPSPAPATAAPVNRPVEQLDLQRYLGTWHEIAHLPQFFQRKCASDITAEYSRNADGSLKVVNACRTKEGVLDAASGQARTTGGPQGALEVRFAPAWLSWLPFVWADYWVLDVDPEYRWAVVGGPGRDALWILSREPRMSRALFERLKADARARGYPVEKLELMAPVE